MTEFDKDFVAAFKIAMVGEVGPFFDMDDQETIDGCCSNKAQKKKTGYVNDPDDAGGETKFGIAKNSHQNLNIKKLTLEQAMEIYRDEYWVVSKAAQLEGPLNVIYFDAFINHRPRAAAKMLQATANVVQDGAIGPKTMAAIKALDPKDAAVKFLEIRADFFRRIVQKNPSQAKFLDGWLNRVNRLKDLVKQYKKQ